MANRVSAMRQTHKNKTQDLPGNPQRVASKADPGYDYKNIAGICARFVAHLFPPLAASLEGDSLSCFIFYALRRAKLCPPVTFAALMLLRRLKARFPTAKASSGQRLFITAFMIASKVMVDQSYSNKSWAKVAESKFSLRELNHMERDMCKRLDWEFSIDGAMLENFGKHIIRYFSQDRASYPNFPLIQVSKLAARAAVSGAPLSLSIISINQSRDATIARPASEDNPVTQPSTLPAVAGVSLPHSSIRKEGNACVGLGSAEDTSHGSPQTDASPIPGVLPQAEPPNKDSSDQAHLPTSFTFIDGAPPLHPLRNQMFAFAVPSMY